MPNLNRNLFVALACIFSSLFGFSQQAVRDRVVRPIDNQSMVRLKGALHPLASSESDQGPVSPALPLERMTMFFQRTAEQESALQQLLADQQDPTSRNYHQWLTPEEFGDRFGLTQHDVALIANWLRSQGFTVEETARSRTWISFSGIAAQVDAAFHTQLHNFTANGKTHYAPAAEPAIPQSLSGIVQGISSLNDFHPHPHAIVQHKTQPRLTSSLSGNHFLAPGDVGTIYNLPDYVSSYDSSGNIVTSFQSGLDGTGQTIAVVGQTQIVGGTGGPFTDVDTFRSIAGLPPTHLQAILTGSDPGISSGDIEEANLDIQWSGAVAPNANIVYVYSKDALRQSLLYIVNNKLGQVISVSYGTCEAQFSQSDLNSIESSLAQANAQGQSISAASGDNLSTDCDGTADSPVSSSTHGLAVDYPASSVYATGLGGTQFDGDSAAVVSNNAAPITQYWDGSSDPNNTSASAFSYIPEVVWNELAATGKNIGTGGGVSKQFSKPAWQIGRTPNDGQRDVPDVSIASSADHDGYLICSQGSCQTGYRKNSDQTFTVIGGTSTATPVFAGIAALANQKLGSAQGNLNPAIYALATGSSSWAFHDITSGDNKAQCTSGTTDCNATGTIGYSAAPGYDLVTGWGTVDVSAFVNALAGTPQPGFNLLATGDRTSTQSNLTHSIQVVSEQGFSGTVTISCSSSLPAVTCPQNSGHIDPNTPFQVAVTGAWDPTASFGTQSGAITYTGTSGSVSNRLVIPAQLPYQDFAFTNGGLTLNFSGAGSQPVSLQLQSNYGFADTVLLTCTSDNPQFTCSGSSSVALAANQVATANFTVTNTTSANATGNVTVQGTSQSHSQLVHNFAMAVTAVAPDYNLTVSSSSLGIASGGTGTDTVTIAGLQGFKSDVALSCTVSSSLGATSCSLSPGTVAGGNGTSALTIHAATLAMNHGAPGPFHGKGMLYTFALAVGVVFTTGPTPRRKRGRNALLQRLGLMLLVAVLLPAASCGGGSKGSSGSGTGSTPLSGTVTVQGAGGGVTHSATISVTIS